MPSHIFHHRLERCFGYHIFDTNILFCSNKQAICWLFSSQSSTWISIAIYRDLFVFCNDMRWVVIVRIVAIGRLLICIFTNNVFHILSSCLKSMRFLSGVFFLLFLKTKRLLFSPRGRHYVIDREESVHKIQCEMIY